MIAYDEEEKYCVTKSYDDKDVLVSDYSGSNCEAIASSTIFYVSNSGNDSNNGSKSNPFNSLYKAYQTVALNGGTIKVLNDIETSGFTMNLSKNISIKGIDGIKKITFTSCANYWAEGDGTIVATSDNNSTLTLLNLDLDFACRGIDSMNSMNLVINNSTLKGGHSYDYGGGCLQLSNNSTTINNSNITDCVGGSGGAIDLHSGSLVMNGGSITNSRNNINSGGAVELLSDATFNNVNFSGNISSGSGGAIHTNNGVNLYINGVTFSNNKAYSAGAVSGNGYLSVNNATFTNNQAIGNNSGSGGAIDSNGITYISNCTFEGNNTSSYNGGAIYSNNDITIIDSFFNNNTSHSYGGALYFNGSTLNITNSSFTNNIATGFGGAISTVGNVSLNNCTITGNTVNNTAYSTANGGGINISSGTLTLNGGLIDNNVTNNNTASTAIYASNSVVFTNNGTTINGTCTNITCN